MMSNTRQDSEESRVYYATGGPAFNPSSHPAPGQENYRIDAYSLNTTAPVIPSQEFGNGYSSRDQQLPPLRIYYQHLLNEQNTYQFRSAMREHMETTREVQCLSSANAELHSELCGVRGEVNQLIEDQARRTKEEGKLRLEIKKLLEVKDRNTQEIRKIKEANRRLKAQNAKLIEEAKARDGSIERLEAEGSVARSLVQKLHWENKEQAQALREAFLKAACDTPTVGVVSDLICNPSRSSLYVQAQETQGVSSEEQATEDDSEAILHTSRVDFAGPPCEVLSSQNHGEYEIKRENGESEHLFFLPDPSFSDIFLQAQNIEKKPSNLD
ncbi:hypothetical protein C0989_011195 [Termitomyces sp. Mn162]|nr:hypothetical protein C0989_011195 [Termitomyces sp. Mn162]